VCVCVCVLVCIPFLPGLWDARAVSLQGGKECLVLLSTRCPDTKLYTITLPWAQMREREDTGLAGARALIDAGIKSSSVVRNGAPM